MAHAFSQLPFHEAPLHTEESAAEGRIQAGEKRSKTIQITLKSQHEYRSQLETIYDTFFFLEWASINWRYMCEGSKSQESLPLTIRSHYIQYSILIKKKHHFLKLKYQSRVFNYFWARGSFEDLMEARGFLLRKLHMFRKFSFISTEFTDLYLCAPSNPPL